VQYARERITDFYIGVADSEPPSSFVLDEEWALLWQGQHWYARSVLTYQAAGLTMLIMTYIGHTFRHKSAGAFGPDLAKKLSQLVKMEKNVMRSMELVSRERMEVAVSSCHFGSNSEPTLIDVLATTFHLGRGLRRRRF
jgi:hypothetical protein